MTKSKWTKRQTLIYKTLHRKLEIEQHEPYKNTGGELRYSVRVSGSICGVNQMSNEDS